MKIFTLADALASLCSDTEWSIYGNDYDRIIWHKPGYVPPTKEALETEVVRLQTEYDATEYQRMRSPEYPPLQDLADALYWQAQGNNEPMNRYLEACAVVKDKYPKTKPDTQRSNKIVYSYDAWSSDTDSPAGGTNA